MKTVMDAVNELKGDLGNSFHFKGNETHLVQGVGALVSVDFKPTDEESICTIEQFNTLAQECMTNFGTDITYAEYKAIHNNYLNCLKARKADKTKKESNMKPVFTQEMSDNGELPSVGMECLIMFPSSNYKGTITYMGKGVGVYHSKDNDKEYTFAFNTVTFEPLDTRTDKEKAIDEACLIIDDSKRCIDTNINIDCSAAQKAVIITMIERGYTKGGK